MGNGVAEEPLGDVPLNVRHGDEQLGRHHDEVVCTTGSKGMPMVGTPSTAPANTLAITANRRWPRAGQGTGLDPGT